MLVDSHCHLDYFKTDTEIAAVIDRARTSGVEMMLCIGVTLRAHGNMMRIVRAHDDVYASVGLHPCHVGDEEEVTAEQLIAACDDDKVIAIGESGLDYFRKPFDKDKQKQSFTAHIQAAQATGLPLVVHNRAADADVITMLEQHYRNQPFACILHCFDSDLEMMRRATAMGFYISFSGLVTYKKADTLRTVAAAVPEPLLLIETDAPYLAPEPMRGQRNEPQFIRHIAKILAEVRDMPFETLASVTRDNFYRLMRRLPAQEAAHAD